MKVGIIGSGEVGQHLGTGFAATGHEVMVGSREPASEKLAKWTSAAGPKASTGTFADAAKFGELVVVATLWSGTESALRIRGPRQPRRQGRDRRDQPARLP